MLFTFFPHFDLKSFANALHVLLFFTDIDKYINLSFVLILAFTLFKLSPTLKMDFRLDFGTVKGPEISSDLLF